MQQLQFSRQRNYLLDLPRVRFMSAIASMVVEFKLNEGDVMPRRGGAVFMVHRGRVSIRIEGALICVFSENQVFGEYNDNLTFQDKRVSITAESVGTVIHAFKAECLQEMEESWSEDPTWLTIKQIHSLYNWRWRYKIPLFSMYPEDISQQLKSKWRKSGNWRRVLADINPGKRTLRLTCTTFFKILIIKI